MKTLDTFNFFCRIRRVQTGLIVIAILSMTHSCESDKSHDIVDDERSKIIELLKKNGFVQMPTKGLRVGSDAVPSNVENKSFNNYPQAVAFVNEINTYTPSSSGNNVKRSVNGGRVDAGGRMLLVPCDDQGVFYINRATYGLFSDVNVRFERDANTNLTNVGTNVTGLALYQWNQLGVNIMDKHNFCIDVNVVFGIDIQGLPTSWAKQGSLRIWLDQDGSCHAYTSFAWGHC